MSFMHINPKEKTGPRSVAKQRVMLALALFAVAFRPLPVYACTPMLMGFASGSAAAITAQIAAMSLAFSTGFIRLNDAIVRLANQGTSDENNRNKQFSSINDKVLADITAKEIGQKRAEAALEFTPSRVTCGIVSNQLRVAATEANYTAVRASMARSNTSRSLNGPGSGTERGTIQAISTVFKNRCDRYMNTAVITIPPGLTCNGPSDSNFIDLDIQPFRSILEPLNIDTDPLKQAAADSIIMLTEPIPPDPVRGPQLARQEGQSSAVYRLRDVTRMNVARAALEDIVAMRTTAAACSSGDNSRLARYVELITGQKVTGNTVSGSILEIALSGEPENARLQAIAARLASQKMMLMELLRLTDHLVSIASVNLALKAEATRSGGASIASRATGGN